MRVLVLAFLFSLVMVQAADTDFAGPNTFAIQGIELS
jgi:hypothetical protein